MGAWGNESCACDDCWDLFYAKNIHEMTQKEADRSVKEAFKKKARYDWQIQARLGVIVWILNQGLKVGNRYLKLVQNYPNRLLKDKEHMDSWREPDERKRCLREERQQIKEALKNDGVGKLKYTKGLMEKMADILGG
jgi:hypothetical protein